MRGPHLVIERVLVASACAICLGTLGCAGPTQTIRQGQDFCRAGIQYTEALDKLLDVTITTVIDFDSDELLRQRKRADPNDLAGFLTQRDEALTEQVKTLETFRNHGRQLRAYFVNLQALANAKLQDSAEAAVSSLSGSIAAANENLRESDDQDFNEEEQAYLGQLGGLVAKHIQAGALRRALHRDAAIIGEQLVLHERLIKKLGDILMDRSLDEIDTLWRQKVRKPYLDTNQMVGEPWKQDRAQWIRSSFYQEELRKATEAIHHMRFIWMGILQGEQDVESLQLALGDIGDFAETVHALHEVGKDKED